MKTEQTATKTNSHHVTACECTACQPHDDCCDCLICDGPMSADGGPMYQ